MEIILPHPDLINLFTQSFPKILIRNAALVAVAFILISKILTG